MLSFTMLCHANYIFDVSKPQQVQVVIENKEVRAGAREITRYIFYATINGEELAFDVNKADYLNYEIGEQYTVYQYRGGFHETYYY